MGFKLEFVAGNWEKTPCGRLYKKCKPPTKMQTTDEKWMRAALDWSFRGKGHTSPRPSVGCVIVKNDLILGGGHTQRGNGNPHAEVMALREAAKKGDVAGATAYVTLEPCSHFATTPPCCDALISHKIARVVAGVVDPNPLVAGNGFLKLRAAGVEVVQGVLADDCFRAQDEFLVSIVQKRPFVTLKAAVSLDGKIARPDGQSKWISGPQSREEAHLLRAWSDAVLVGIETVLCDNPTLDVRLKGDWPQPKRIVLDSRARLPLDAKIWHNAPELLVFVASTAEKSRVDALKARGATVIEAPHGQNGLDWDFIGAQLYARDCISLLIEGGARVAGSALQAKIVHKIAFFVAPLLIGEGKSALSGFQTSDLSLAPRLQLVRSRVFGVDTLIDGYLL